jgi:hypothetical protein
MRAQATTIEVMPDPSPMLTHFDWHLRRALRRAKAHADRVIVVRQPWLGPPHTAAEEAHMWHGGAGKVWQEDVTTFFSLDILARLMSLLDAKASRIARELEVEQLDLTELLDRSLETYYDTFHATPAGARLAAAAVAAAVLRQPLESVTTDPAIAAAASRTVARQQKIS